MLSPVSLLPARVISEPAIFTCSWTSSFRQFELSVELPTSRPWESSLTTTVMRNDSAFASFETNVPDHVPRRADAEWRDEGFDVATFGVGVALGCSAPIDVVPPLFACAGSLTGLKPPAGAASDICEDGLIMTRDLDEVAVT